VGARKWLSTSELTGARPGFKLIKKRDVREEELSESKRRKTVKIEKPVVKRKKKLTDSEDESKYKK